VGCMGRRSPGRSGRGGPPPGVIGRGRWKIGCPGTGRPGAGRIVPAGDAVGDMDATGAIGRGGGALYTGRGPVCGTIMRGAGGCGGPATAGGRGAAAGGWGAADDEIVGAAVDVEIDGGVTTEAGGGVGRGGAATGAVVEADAAIVGAAGVTLPAGFSATGATNAGRAGTGVVVGAEIEGVAGGGVGRATGGTTTGLATTAGGAAGRTGAGGAAASFFCVIALSTSPGREMFDKSILVLISSSPRSGRDARADGACASDEPRRCTRTFSASCSSSELEWVFFSVTPTMGSVSRMALLLTSSSLARSLIRTLLIRPFLYSALC
jgi:hypothetical protein